MTIECRWCGEPLTAGKKFYCSKSCSKKYHEAFIRFGNDEGKSRKPYGSHGFDPIVANWMHRMTIPGSTLCGV